MDKKTNYLAIIPIFGSVILFLWLYIKLLKHEINTKKFLACFISSALLGFLSIVVVMLFLYFINYLFDIKIFIENYGMIVAFVIGGYLLNLFSFVSINKNWDNLQNKD